MTRRHLYFSLFALYVLAACSASGATPQLIGAYPKTTNAPPQPIVYNTHLTLEVYDPASTADRVIQLAYDYSGYLVSSDTWRVGDDRYFTVVVTVPAAQFSAIREAVVNLGTLVNETVTSDGPSPNWDTYSTLTINLNPISPRLPRPPAIGWNPGHTFAEAFSVFARLFTYLADVVIWMVVVGGPFVLMGLGLRAVVRWARRKP